MENFQKFLFTAIFLFVGLNIQAQSLTVTGKVIDSDGFEVIGAQKYCKSLKLLIPNVFSLFKNRSMSFTFVHNSFIYV